MRRFVSHRSSTPSLLAALVLCLAAPAAAQTQERKPRQERESYMKGELDAKAPRGTLEGKCNTKDNVVAVTNGVETTIKSPKNEGDCEFTLRCRDKEKKTVGKPATLPKDGMLQSYSCGKDAVDIALDCGGESGVCRLTYTDS